MTDIPDKNNVVSVDTLSEHLDLDVRRVQQLVKEGVCHRNGKKRGQYLLKESVIGYVQFLRDDESGAAESPLAKRKVEADVRIKESTARRQERENDRAEGMLTPAVGIEDQSSALFGAVYLILEQIAPRVKRAIPDIPDKAIAIIEKQIVGCQNTAASMQIQADGTYVPEELFAGDDDIDDELA